MRLRLHGWLLASLCLAAFAYLIVGQVQSQRAAPSIVYPRVLELGERELGEIVVAPFALANRGRAPLIVDSIRTRCSCSGIEHERNGAYERLHSLRIQPGQEVHVVMRLAMRGIPANASLTNSVEFRTNDPEHPLCRIDAHARRVSAGISTSPPALVIGTVQVGRKVTHVLDVRDTANPPRKVERVTNSIPELLNVRILPVNQTTRGNQANSEGVLIGQLEVAVATGYPGPVEGEIQIYLADDRRKPDTVRVTGRIVPAIEILPSLLTLPRLSETGPVYDATCICRSTRGEPLSLHVDSAPNGIQVDFFEQQNSTIQIIRVTWLSQERRPPGANERRLVRLRATAGKDDFALELPVLIRGL